MNIGILLVLLSSLFFTLSSYFGKVVTNVTNMSGVITSFGRFFIGTIFMIVYILFTKRSLKTPNIKPILYRAVFNSITIILYSIAYNYTTITNVNMLHMTFPVFVVLLAPYFTKEKIKKNTYIYLIIIMMSIYIVANPNFGSFNLGDLLALISALSASISTLALTESRKENPAYLIIFYGMVFGTIINIPTAYKDLNNFDMSGLFPVIISATMGVLGQIFITWGYKYVDSATGSLISASRIIMAAIIGFIFLSEPLNIRIIIGIVLVTLSLVGMSGYFNKKGKVEA